MSQQFQEHLILLVSLTNDISRIYSSKAPSLSYQSCKTIWRVKKRSTLDYMTVHTCYFSFFFWHELAKEHHDMVEHHHENVLSIFFDLLDTFEQRNVFEVLFKSILNIVLACKSSNYISRWHFSLNNSKEQKHMQYSSK